MKDLRDISMNVGVVIRRLPGVTRWAAHSWKAVAVLPGAPDAHWKEMRRDGEAVEFHAGTLPLTLHRADAEAYASGLASDPPVVYVVLRDAEESDAPFELHAITASPYEAQDFLDTGEEVVEPVPMPPELISWVADFTEAHYRSEPFKKRKRRNWSDEGETGRGDPRIRQEADVYRAPGTRKETLQ